MKAQTPPKGAPTPKQKSRQRNLAPTMMRRYHGQDHRPPDVGVWDANDHHLWHGTTRVADRGARRRANRASWVKILRTARRTHMASKAVG